MILAYSGPTTYNSVKTLTESLGQPIPQALEQVRGYYRYLTHMDNPEKAQYDSQDIKHLGGFNVADFMELTKSEVFEIKKHLMTLIRDNEIYEYADLLEALQDAEMFAELDVALSNTMAFNGYIRSRRHKLRGGGTDGSSN